MDTKDKYHYIDTLRFLAIFFIVFMHFDNECFHYFMGSTMTEKYFSRDYWTGWLLFGWTGKCALALLCIISGYLTAMKFEDLQECDLAEFVIRRYLRLMLPVLGVNVFFGLWQVLASAGEVDWMLYIRAGLVPGMSDVNRNLWCINDFLVSNIIVCLIAYVRKRNTRAGWIYLPVLAILVLMGRIWMFAGVAGGLCYLTSTKMKEKKLVNSWWLAGLVPFMWLLVRVEEGTTAYYRDIAAAFLLMVSFHCIPGMQRVFAFKWMKGVKKFSYSLFVVHGMTLFFEGPAWILLQNIGVKSYSGLFWGLFLLTILFDLCIAFVIYYLFENKTYKALGNLILNGKQPALSEK